MEHVFSWFIQQQAQIDVLYGDRWIIQAVVRALQPLSQQYNLRLAFIDGEFPLSEIELWCRQPADDDDRKLVQATHTRAVKELCGLGLWKRSADGSTISVHPQAQHVMKAMFCNPQASSLPAAGASDQVAVSAFGNTQWAAVLGFMVDPSNASFIEGRETSWIPGVLHDMGLMNCQVEAEQGGMTTMLWTLTSQGYRYLLEGAEVQLWKLLMAYLQFGASRVTWTDKTEFNQGQLMGLLCMLTFMDAGSIYSVSGLSDCQKEACRRDLRGCGLVYIAPNESQSKPKMICPTPVATGQWDPHAECAKRTSDVEQGIIVESNFRVYMYSDGLETGTIEEALLSLFVRIDYTMPQLCCGTFTRNSICAGLKIGIDVEFVIYFLTKHAHPCMLKGTQSKVKLPRNVVHQIELWAKDYNKLDVQPSTLWVGGFSSLQTFKQTLRAVKQGLCLPTCACSLRKSKKDHKCTRECESCEHVLWRTDTRQLVGAAAEERGVTEENDWAMIVADTEEVIAKIRSVQPGLIMA